MQERKLVNSLCGALLAGWTLITTAYAADLSPKYGSLLEKLSDNNHAIQKHPQLAPAYVDRSETYTSMGRFKDAMNDVDTAISLDPQEETAYAQRGKVWQKLKKYEQALADLDHAIQMDPLNATFVHWKGEVYAELGQSELATKNYNQAKILGYGDSGPEFGPYMADMQRRIKHVWFPPKGDESKEIVTKFWLSRNGNVSGAEIERSSGVPLADAAALKAISNASPLAPLPLGSFKKVQIEFSFTYNVYGSELRNEVRNGTIVRTAKLPVAETMTYKTGTLTFSDWTKIELDLKKKLAEAEKKGDELSAVSPLLALADGYSDRGKYDQAESAYKRAEAILEKQKNKGSATAMVMGRLARMYATQGKLSEAENLYKQALERDPDELSHSRREIITGYAKLLYEASRFDEANKLYDLLRVDAFAGNKKVTKVQTHK